MSNRTCKEERSAVKSKPKTAHFTYLVHQALERLRVLDMTKVMQNLFENEQETKAKEHEHIIGVGRRATSIKRT